MRHGKKFNHLGRQASHRKAMLSNMCASLILHKRISTTLAKAKELKKHVEPLVTRAKEDTTHNRRMAFSVLQSKEAIKVLFGEVAEKVGNRPGGYTRIIKTGYRLGDNAEMCIIELVDFNELMLKDAKPAKKTTRRSRRGSGKAAGTATAPKAAEETAEKTQAPADEAVATPSADAAEAATDAEANKAEESGADDENKKGE
ncbi:MAG TPA: 50S ribosomal protein L17 [Cyclobacteriaceae bacterium]|nr:50S ribosomal protein L17 [Cyclobacteriaceae bacterium]